MKTIKLMHKLSVLFTLLAMTVYGQQNTPKDAFLEKWVHSKDYLIQIVEAMPEENFTFKPTEREMDFGSQLLHIRGNMLWLGNTYFTEVSFDKKSLKKNIPKGKAAIIEALKTSFDAVYAFVAATTEEGLKGTVEFFAGPKSRMQILNLLQDHVTHHRGQLIVYLNLNSIEPPQYSGW
ncbi:MAG: putative damage-inducible protein DinB [Dokdonia sp.]|jgi:uncharacterized damage-inducible protein DinB